MTSQDGDTQLNVLINNKHSLDLTVLFKPKSADLTDKARTLLNDLADALQDEQLSKATYLIGGHTDARGEAERNRKLSEQRARSVKAYLVNNFGIDPRRLATAGYGEDRLADRDNPEDGINRRIEVSLISTGYNAPKKRIAKAAKTTRTASISRSRVQTTSARSSYRAKPRTNAEQSYRTEPRFKAEPSVCTVSPTGQTF